MVSLILQSFDLFDSEFGDLGKVSVSRDEGGSTKELFVLGQLVGSGKLLRIRNDLFLVVSLQGCQ